MINPTYLKAIKQFQGKPTLCNFFQLLSVDTWERIKFARTRKGLKIFETTITQNLLFELNRTKELVNALMGANYWNFRIYESRNEKANGNDIELYVPFKNGFLFFPSQAKIIYHQGFRGKYKMKDGNYPSMDHHVKTTGRQQIDSLLRYANARNGYPLYFLYNYVNDQFQKSTKCNVDFEIEQYGCSAISAVYIKKKYYNSGTWKIPKFSDLHPKYAHPWFILACCLPKLGEIKEVASTYFPIDEEFPTRSLKIYTPEEVDQSVDWKYFALTGVPEEAFSLRRDENQIDFIPKFKIVIELERV